MELSPLVAVTYAGLADALERGPAGAWDAPSPCTGWRVREVVGDFQRLSDAIAARDAGRPLTEHLRSLCSAVLALLCHRTLPDGRTLGDAPRP